MNFAKSLFVKNEYFSRHPPPNEDEREEGVEFYLRLCFDVLLEALKFGDRHPLTKLERAGRRLHWLMEKYFFGVPFLRLDLLLKPKFVFIYFS